MPISIKINNNNNSRKANRKGSKKEKDTSFISNLFHAKQLKFSQHNPTFDEAYWGP